MLCYAATHVFAVLMTFKAVVTQYSREDSCELSTRNPHCLMASGVPVYEGAVACPTFLKFKQKIRIDGKIYHCEDRYAAKLDKKRGLPTIDIFVEGDPKGRTVKLIEVIE